MKPKKINKILLENNGKLDWTLLDWKSIEPLVHGMMFGKEKHHDKSKNWKEEELQKDPKRHLSSAMRHLISLIEDNEVDAESGVLHTGHIMCRMMMYNFHIINKTRKESK